MKPRTLRVETGCPVERFAVTIPYMEPDGSHPERVYEATIEVAARTPGQARVLATREFRNLTELSYDRGRREVQADDISVRPVAGADEPLTLTVGDMAPGIARLDVSGKLDAETERQFQAQMRSLSGGAARRLVIDLSGLEYINSSSIGELAACMSTLEIRLARVQPGVLRVLKMVGLDRAIPCFDSAEDAAASF